MAYLSIGKRTDIIRMRDKILDAAERRARSAGYAGFSFRDVAQDVGIKSASVHYHFPTKSDLAVALVRRYSDRVLGGLGDPGSLGKDAAIDRICGIFEYALMTEDKMCLCGLFGAEHDALPPTVADVTAEFFSKLLDYARQAMTGSEREGYAETLIAALEGGLIMSRALKDPSILRVVIGAFASGPRNLTKAKSHNRA